MVYSFFGEWIGTTRSMFLNCCSTKVENYWFRTHRTWIIKKRQKRHLVTGFCFYFSNKGTFFFFYFFFIFSSSSTIFSSFPYRHYIVQARLRASSASVSLVLAFQEVCASMLVSKFNFCVFDAGGWSWKLELTCVMLEFYCGSTAPRAENIFLALEIYIF